MSLAAVRQRLTDRLDEGDRGDRGWFIITRVHVAISWLKQIAEYLEARGSGATIRPTDSDYRQLGRIIGTDRDDPGVQLRRHNLLVMDKPLQLLERTNEPSWTEFTLTPLGRQLALADDPAEVLEHSLEDIRFSQAPWSPANRVQQYREFDVPVYRVTKRVLEQCDGYIDRDEFDFFLSRIRREREIGWAIDSIALYRQLAADEQRSLRVEVSHRIPGRKSYQNWRDIALHTFSLFSLGTSMIREDHRLLQTAAWVRSRSAAPQRAGTKRSVLLRIPAPPEIDELLTPPTAPASNAGTDAESFVAKILRSQGWKVAFYTNRRGYGFDLWARRGNVAMVVEVKSSLKNLGTVDLTPLEYRAAQDHGDSYVLALVEAMDSDSPQLRMIQNPIANLEIVRRDSSSYAITRREWLRASAENP